jgi:hypothetical protein
MSFRRTNSGDYMAVPVTDAYLESVYGVEFADGLVAEW